MVPRTTNVSSVVGHYVEEVLRAESCVRPYIRETYLEYSFHLSNLGHAQVHLKMEHLQYTGSFKLRGAMNKLLSLSSDELNQGIVTASNGNHGIAVCFAARQIGTSA